jgi:hypothetical protein
MRCVLRRVRLRTESVAHRRGPEADGGTVRGMRAGCVVGLRKGHCGVGGNGVNVWDGVVIGRWWKLVSGQVVRWKAFGNRSSDARLDDSGTVGVDGEYPATSNRGSYRTLRSGSSSLISLIDTHS